MNLALGTADTQFSKLSLAASLLLIAALGVVWWQRLVHGDGDAKKVRRGLMITSVWAASLSAVGLLAFSTYEVIVRPYRVLLHWGSDLVVSLCGLFLSPIGLLGVFAFGSRRWLLIVSSLTLTALWFMSALDNINW